MDEVVREAPWVLDDAFLTKHKIDFVAHDDVPYTIGSGTDIYAGLKEVSLSNLCLRYFADYLTETILHLLTNILRYSYL